MYQETEYILLGGYGSKTYEWFNFKESRLFEAIAGKDSPLMTVLEDNKDGIELVLGIWYNGASCLLMPASQLNKLRRVYPNQIGQIGRLRLASEFVSLSPISFHNRGEFENKYKKYKPKPKKKGKERSGLDDSQANKAYMLSNKDAGVQRGAFEHNRVLFRLINGDLKDPSRFSVGDPSSWASRLRVFALTFNTLSIDNRRFEEQIKEPIIVDIAWTQLDVPSMLPRQDKTVRFRIKTTVLKNPNEHEYMYGTTEKLEISSVAERLRKTLLSPTPPEERRAMDDGDAPTILLVFNEKLAHGVFRTMGIESEVQWEQGVKFLLDRGRRVKEEKADPGYVRRRSRSPSPRRKDFGSARRTRSPMGRHLPRPYDDVNADTKPILGELSKGGGKPKVHLVDVQALACAITQHSALGGLKVRIGNAAHYLGVSVPLTTPLDDSIPQDGANPPWCAGNECHIIAYMWRRIITGPPIDEQRPKLPSGPPPPGFAAIPPRPDVDVDDEGFDPNSLTPSQPVLSAPDPFQDLDSDEDW